MKQQGHQSERILIGFCVAAYFVSYITRINYGTVLLEITDGVKIVIDATMIYPSMQDAIQTGSEVKKD